MHNNYFHGAASRPLPAAARRAQPGPGDYNSRHAAGQRPAPGPPQLRLATPANPLPPFPPASAPGVRDGVAGGAGGFESAARRLFSPVPRSAMNFSELFKLSGLLGRFSPDGKCLVSTGRCRLGRGGGGGVACATGAVPARPPEETVG